MPAYPHVIDDDYLPIDCSLHDRIEDLATRRSVVRIRYEADRGEPAALDDAIADWFVREGVEFMRTASGVEIRLDRVLSVDGIEYR